MLVDSNVRICTLETWLYSNFSAGAHPPVKIFSPPLRRCAGAAQPYIRLCVCSGSLLTRSKRNINSNCQVPGLHRVEVQRPLLWSRLVDCVGLSAKTRENSAVLTASRVEYSKAPSSHDVTPLHQ